MEKITLAIQNMKCGGCAKTITNALNQIEGVSVSSIDAENGTVTLAEWNEDLVEKVSSELRRLGYPLENEDNPLFSKVKSYASCMVGRMS